VKLYTLTFSWTILKPKSKLALILISAVPLRKTLAEAERYFSLIGLEKLIVRPALKGIFPKS
jgi:hypothetical protein